MDTLIEKANQNGYWMKGYATMSEGEKVKAERAAVLDLLFWNGIKKMTGRDEKQTALTFYELNLQKGWYPAVSWLIEEVL